MGKKKSDSEAIMQEQLFPVEQYADRTDLVEQVKRGFNHTGKNLMGADEVLCREVMIDLIRGVSGRAIARKFKISRNSVGGIRRAMEERGLVEPLKKQISGLLGNIITMGLEDFQDALSTGELHPSQLPVPMGIFMTHKALVDGDPTVRVDSGKPQEISVESVQRYYEEMKKAQVVEVKTLASESESPVKKENTQ
jgi:hypothetical protein